jgi:hypothetical protein
LCARAQLLANAAERKRCGGVTAIKERAMTKNHGDDRDALARRFTEQTNEWERVCSELRALAGDDAGMRVRVRADHELLRALDESTERRITSPGALSLSMTRG